jgi:hypothetical protein
MTYLVANKAKINGIVHFTQGRDYNDPFRAGVQAMWKFYKAVFRTAIREFWTATDDVLTGVAVLSFLAILLSRKYGEHLVTAWNGVSPWWSLVPIGLLVMYRLLRANYEQFEVLRREHAVELKATEDRSRKTVSALEETTRGTLAAAEEQHRKALQSEEDNSRSLRAELSATQQQLAALQRDWARDWKELAAQFRELVNYRIFAQWRRLSDGQSWDITGGVKRLSAELSPCANMLGTCFSHLPRYLRA